MTDSKTIRLVILFLGTTALLLTVGGMWLVRDLIRLSAGTGQIDAAAAAVIGGITTLAGTTVGALGALLVSTRSSTSEPVEVINPPGEAITVEDAP